MSIRSARVFRGILAVHSLPGKSQLVFLTVLLALVAVSAEADGTRSAGYAGDGTQAGGGRAEDRAAYRSPVCEALLVQSGLVPAAECYVDSAGSAPSAPHRSEWYKRSGNLFEQAELFHRALAVYQSGGDYAFREGLYPQALYMYERGAELQEEVFGDWEVAGHLYRGAALAAEAKGDLDLSLSLHSGSGERFTQAGSFEEAAESYQAAAALARQTGRLDFYESLSRRAAELAAKSDAR